MILAGDFGGTKCCLALFNSKQGKLKRVAKTTYQSRDFQSAEEVIADFLTRSGSPKVTRACFGVAGPVFKGVVKFVNLNWKLSGKDLEQRFKIRKVLLVNDLVATLYGIDRLSPSHFFWLQRGKRVKSSPLVVIGVGTGMNEMIAFWDAERGDYIPIPSESGHTDFAPRDYIQIDFLRSLKKKYPSVSWEMVLTGNGLKLIHELLDPKTKHPSFDNPKLSPGPEISLNARKRKCGVCVRTLRMWASMYGAEAGNVALRALAKGGIYLAGSVTEGGLYKFGSREFVSSFAKKPNLGGILRRIPVKIILNKETPLLGAAHLASRKNGLI